MIIIKEVPGMTAPEVLDALNDISNSPVATGHGGFVIPEEVAYEFLRAFLIVSGYLRPDPIGEPEPEPERRTMVDLNNDQPKRRPGRPRKVQP